MTATRPTFDPSPLLRQVELTTNPSVEKFGRGKVTDVQVAEVLGVQRRQVTRWRQGQQLNARNAERLAERIGFLPCELWPSWYEATCAKPCEECGGSFVPAVWNQRFCAPRCKWRAKSRRARATPEGAEYNRATRRAYYAKCAEYERAYHRRWLDKRKQAA